MVDKTGNSPRRPEESEQLGEGLLLPGAVEELLQPKAADRAREGRHLLEVEEPLREGLLQPGVVEEALKPEVYEVRGGPCLLGEEPLMRGCCSQEQWSSCSSRRRWRSHAGRQRSPCQGDLHNLGPRERCKLSWNNGRLSNRL